jgi:hypothetical protein
MPDIIRSEMRVLITGQILDGFSGARTKDAVLNRRPLKSASAPFALIKLTAMVCPDNVPH